MLEQVEEGVVVNPPSRLIRLKEVMHRVGLGRSTIYRWMDEGKFPKPHSLGGYAVAWLEADVDEWIEKQVTHREESLIKSDAC